MDQALLTELDPYLGWDSQGTWQNFPNETTLAIEAPDWFNFELEC